MKVSMLLNDGPFLERATDHLSEIRIGIRNIETEFFEQDGPTIFPEQYFGFVRRILTETARRRSVPVDSFAYLLCNLLDEDAVDRMLQVAVSVERQGEVALHTRLLLPRRLVDEGRVSPQWVQAFFTMLVSAEPQVVGCFMVMPGAQNDPGVRLMLHLNQLFGTPLRVHELSEEDVDKLVAQV